MKRVISITYDGDGCESKHLIDGEDDQYVYFTSEWHGQHMRYNKLENLLEILGLDGLYHPTTDCILQVDITD